jgi:hypothetical protein
MATIADLAAASSASAGDMLVIRQGSTDRKIDAGLAAWLAANNSFTGTITLAGTAPAKLTLTDIDNGSGGGPRVVVGRNNNASTPAAGAVLLYLLGGSFRYLWADNSGNLRVSSSAVTNANDTAGTVVGTQTSSLDSKHIYGAPPIGAEALTHVRAGALAVREFTYKDGSFNGERFSGLITDLAPRYGMDRDADHPAGKSLNVINAIGDLMLAVSYLAQRLAEHEANHV